MNIITKIISASLIFLLSTQAFAAGASSKACAKYKDVSEEYKSYCESIWFCENMYSPTTKWENFLKLDQIPFLPIPDKKAVQKIMEDSKENWNFKNNDKVFFSVSDWYWALLTDFVDKLPSISGDNNIWSTPLDQAKNVYVKVQNALYNCAVLEAKLKITDKILQIMKTDTTSNVVSKIEQAKENINSEISQRWCNKAPAEWKKSYREMLLNNVTYHYCNYKNYLNYLLNYSDYNLVNPSLSSKVKRPWDDKMSTADALKFSSKQTISIQEEITHAKQVYNMSVSTFSEFENTYWLHILLTLIYDDYANIRTNLWKLLNPISQLAYKIPQAQK